MKSMPGIHDHGSNHAVSNGYPQPGWMQSPTNPSPGTDEDQRIPVTDRGLLAVTGADAADFLHAQFSSNMRDLSPGQSRFTSYSDARGRLLAVLRVLAVSEGFLLEMPADRLEPIAARLRRYVLRSRVEIEDASAASCAFGLSGKGIASLWQEPALPADGEWRELDDGVRVAGLPGQRPRWLVFGPETALRVLWQRFDDLPVAPPHHWDLLDIEAGLPAVHTQTEERFVAQMVNLDRLEALDFHKGCYPGQEVIARTHYLGRIKRRMFPLHAPGAGQPPAPGEPVLNADSGDPAGEIVRAAPHPAGGALALAVLRLDALDASLTLADGTPVTRRDPPYPLDEAA